MMTDSKREWDRILSKAGALLRQAYPVENNAVAENQRDFILFLSGESKLMKKVKEKMAIGDVRAKQSLVDLFKGYCTKLANKKTTATKGGGGGGGGGGRGPPGAPGAPSPVSQTNDDAQWQRVNGRTRTTSTSPTTTSSQPPRPQRRQPYLDQGKSNATETPWKDFEPHGDSPLLDPAGQLAQKLDLDAPLEEASGYSFCSHKQAAKYMAKYVDKCSNSMVFILPLVLKLKLMK
jgi:hypothetical protein